MGFALRLLFYGEAPVFLVVVTVLSRKSDIPQHVFFSDSSGASWRTFPTRGVRRSLAATGGGIRPRGLVDALAFPAFAQGRQAE